MEAYEQNFLWGTTSTKRKLHLLKRLDVTTPKDTGGLGIQRLTTNNLAMLASSAWRVFNSDAPWAQILRSKYLRRKNDNSRIWTTIMTGWVQCQIGLQWQPADGKHVLFFTDPWIRPDCSVHNFIQGPLQRHEFKANIDSYKTDNHWIFSELLFDFTQTIFSRINSIYFPRYLLQALDKPLVQHVSRG
ncbi:hypothetical protein FXO37_12216 [Capsicum annuum]|nr:hypothetical protein FXO37_12216 [Capsicum annuum]